MIKGKAIIKRREKQIQLRVYQQTGKAEKKRTK